jgi:hypothetical protein
VLIILVRLSGAFLLILASLNLLLPMHLEWKNDLAKLSLINRQIFLVHAFFIVLILVMMSVLSLFFAPALLDPSPLSRLALGGLTLFWLTRLVIQWFVYDASLWRGNRFNTFMHISFTLLWCFFTAVYGSSLWLQLNH